MLVDALIVISALIAIVLLDVAALRYGHDSRDGVGGRR